MVLTRIFIPGTLLVLCLAVTLPLSAAAPPPSISTDGNIETDAQLVSKVATGTPPLVVSSTTIVPSLNADKLDGEHGSYYASTTVLLDALDALANPDPLCFSNTHRFADCGNGTVTDTVTGLIWLYDANCFGLQDWSTANELATGLEDGECGLTDGSRPGDWRVPKKEEWEGILDPSCSDAAPGIVGNASPSTGCYSDNGWAYGVVVASFYWSSTTNPGNTTNAFIAYVYSGVLFNSALKTNPYYVWPVRGGQ